MTYSIDELNWNTYRQRALKSDMLSSSPNMTKALKKDFKRTHQLMTRMLTCEDERTLVISMNALNSFFDWVHRRTGISATASNFIICKEDSEYEES